jgi:hypothetical protein
MGEEFPPLIEDECCHFIKCGIRPGGDVDDKIQYIYANNLGLSPIAGLTVWLKTRCPAVD